MSIRVSCPGCSKTYNVPDSVAGKHVACRECGERIPVPGDAAMEEEVEEYAESPLDLTTSSSSRSRPRRPRTTRPSPSASGGSSTWKIVLRILGGAAVLIALCCGGIAWKIRSASSDVGVYPNQPDFGPASGRFPVEKYPLPQFPELGPARPIPGSNVVTHFVDFASIPSNRNNAGMEMKLRVYVPPGDHAAKSVPCVLIAPAGTNMLQGNALDDDEYHAETLPYAEAGMAVIFYSIDGGLNDDDEPAQIRESYRKFRAACAGIVNGRNALEFALARLPQVNPQRIYSAGHSSAGTLSLLFATHEPRLKGSIAYAPATDVEKELGEIGEVPGMGLLFPGLKDFAKQSSPRTHMQQLQCPVFLFQAQDDSRIPLADTRRFASDLRAAGKTVTLEEVPDGDHYDSMVEKGIPAGIRWIQNP